MSYYCLDTSAYSNFRRGHEKLAKLIDRAELIGVPTITLGELYTGFMRGSQRERNEADLEELLANPAVEVLPVDAETSWQYADIVVALQRSGTPLPTNDIWIAATAARSGATVLTCDEHFEQISRVGSIVLEPLA